MKRETKGYLGVMHVESMSGGNAEEFFHQFGAANSRSFDNARRKPGRPPSVSQMANHNYLERSIAMKNRSSLMVMRREADMSSRNSQKFQHQFEAENSCDFDKARRKSGRSSSAFSQEAHHNHSKRRNIMKDKSVGRPDLARRKAGRSDMNSQEFRHQFEAENSCDFDKARRKSGRSSSAFSQEAHHNHSKRRNIMKDKSVGRPDLARRKAGRSDMNSQEFRHQSDAENSRGFDKAWRKSGRSSSAVSQEAHHNHSKRRNIMKDKSVGRPDLARRKAGRSGRGSQELQHQSEAASSRGFDKARRKSGRSSSAVSQEAHQNHSERRNIMKGKSVEKSDTARRKAGRSGRNSQEFRHQSDAENSRGFDKARRKPGRPSSAFSQEAHHNHPKRRNIMKGKSVEKSDTARRKAGRSGRNSQEFRYQSDAENSCGFDKARRKSGRSSSAFSQEAHHNHSPRRKIVKDRSVRKPDSARCKADMSSKDMEEYLRWLDNANSRGFGKARHKPGRPSSAFSQKAHHNHSPRRKVVKDRSVRKPDSARCKADMSSKDMDEYLRWLDNANSRGFDKIRCKSGESPSRLQEPNQKCLKRKAAVVISSKGLSNINTKEFLNQCEEGISHGPSNDQCKPGEPFSDSREENQKCLKEGVKMCNANGSQKQTSTRLRRDIIALDADAKMIAACDAVSLHRYISTSDAPERVLPSCHNDILSRLVNMSKGVKNFVKRDWYKFVTASCSIITAIYTIAVAHFG